MLISLFSGVNWSHKCTLTNNSFFLKIVSIHRASMMTNFVYPSAPAKTDKTLSHTIKGIISVECHSFWKRQLPKGLRKHLFPPPQNHLTARSSCVSLCVCSADQYYFFHSFVIAFPKVASTISVDNGDNCNRDCIYAFMCSYIQSAHHRPPFVKVVSFVVSSLPFWGFCAIRTMPNGQPHTKTHTHTQRKSICWSCCRGKSTHTCA